jgi:maltose phosphorylase
MKNYIKADEWNIIEEGFDPHLNMISESLFSIGNGHMGQRANFEEAYSGETLQGNYVAGIYYPDKTRVGWWKNGYPEYFAKVLNAANWIGIDISIGKEKPGLDLHQCRVFDFKRVLNMREGYLERSFKAELPNGKQVAVNAKRFCSIVDQEVGAIRYSITPLNFEGELHITAYIDGDIANKDSNYDEKFWDHVNNEAADEDAYLTLQTKKTGFQVCTGSRVVITQDGKSVESCYQPVVREKYIGTSIIANVAQGQETVICKYAVNVTSQDYAPEQLVAICKQLIEKAAAKGFDTMMAEQAAAWKEKWDESDIRIEGDVAAQQGIRFNIFQLCQTYSGKDDRLNIGPKGFTGEKYGGSTYWDTEAYCVPFYLATAPQQVAKNLLIYRYKQLGKAIENAAKLGFTNGAALYPMVTMNGEECHNEWEITFEEIHRNGAIAFAIYNYVRYTGDKDYLVEYGAEVLIGIARFWAQRVNWSSAKHQFVMLGVTGPNEYENNVNNNWYTNTIACWSMEYASEAVKYIKNASPDKYEELAARINFNEIEETSFWNHVSENMYFPKDESLGVYLQQDGFLDKELIPASELPEGDRPLNQHWSWDRILRSCYIKQADVLQGLYFLGDKFDLKTVEDNYNFYEPLTVHESSLSPCVHAIIAAKIGKQEDAYRFYLRTSRLDLDDYNNDTEDGLHITSMAGTWMSVVEGFAGMHVKDERLIFNPFLPDKWRSYSFNITFRGVLINVKVDTEGIHISNHSQSALTVAVFGEKYEMNAGSQVFAVHKVKV